MSAFSAVDLSTDPARLIAYLEQVGTTAMRHYMAATPHGTPAHRSLISVVVSVATWPRLITNLEASLDRAVAAGIATRREVDAWLSEQRRCAAVDEFCAEMVKVLWVATAP